MIDKSKMVHFKCHCKITTGFIFALALFLNLSIPSTTRANNASTIYIGVAALATVLPGFILDMDQPDSRRSFLKFSMGSFDAVDDENGAVDFSVEYQPPITYNRVRPLMGIAGNTDGSYYAWLAAGHDFHLTGYFVFNVNVGPAVYFAGDDGKDLGSKIVLRSGFDLGYRMEDGGRITAGLHHMSHGELFGDKNPGTEIISVSYSWPLM
jgi:hypothetical protein